MLGRLALGGTGWRRACKVVSGGRGHVLIGQLRQISGEQNWTEKDGPNHLSLTHNIGIIAHIDAGKTTATEKMLYYAGVTSRMGNVDSGSTVMDFLPPERERGITISSAAISFCWRGHTLNLIDTPGHVDFTFEVERSLRVLDGAVALLDGSAGVEAQTIAVWKQAKRYKIPCVVFVNKMDKPNASLPRTVSSMQRQLGVIPLVTQLPLGEGRGLRGVVDLVQGCALLWERGGDGASYSQMSLEQLPEDVRAVAWHGREELVEQVATLDDTLAASVLEESYDPKNLDPCDLAVAIRRVTVSGAAVPVLCGSALRNVAIQPLMDAVSAYLPTASEGCKLVPVAAQGLCAYAFKLSSDPHRGMLAFLRVYSGTLRPHTSLYNINRNTQERVSRVLLAQAGDLQEVGGVGEGNIAVAVGLKQTCTGDTLVQSAAVARALEREVGGVPLLAPPTIPPPVFFCTVEPTSAVVQKDLDQALSCISREDPSLRVSLDKDTGQTVLSGMGELHLEVVQDRLQRHYRVPCQLGPLQVAYKEAPATSCTITKALQQTFGPTTHSVVATVTISPAATAATETPEVTFDPSIHVAGKSMVETVRGAVEGACFQGPLLGFPVLGVAVKVEDLRFAEGTPLPLLSSCVAQCTAKALREVDMTLLEPFTQLEVSVPEKYLGAVLSDLSSVRRAQVQGVGEGAEGEEGRTVTAMVPLATMLGYANGLRSLTSGTATFSTIYSHHHPVDKQHQKALLQQMRGY